MTRAQAIVRHLRHFGRFGFGQPGVGRHADDGVALCGELQDGASGQSLERGERIGKIAAFADFERAEFEGARSGHDFARLGVDDIAKGVDRRNRAYHHPCAKGHAGGADAGFHRAAVAEQFAHAGAAPCADVAFLHRAGTGGGSGAVAHLQRWDARPRAPDVQVEENGRRHNQHEGGAPVSKPMRCSSRYFITPAAASRPKAEPPASTMA